MKATKTHKCDGCRYKGEHQEMGFRPFGVCFREHNLIEAEKAYRADKCPYSELKESEGDKNRTTDKENNWETASKFLGMIFGISEEKRKEWTEKAKNNYYANKDGQYMGMAKPNIIEPLNLIFTTTEEDGE